MENLNLPIYSMSKNHKKQKHKLLLLRLLPDREKNIDERKAIIMSLLKINVEILELKNK